jgi:hypothetical protein
MIAMRFPRWARQSALLAPSRYYFCYLTKAENLALGSSPISSADLSVLFGLYLLLLLANGSGFLGKLQVIFSKRTEQRGGLAVGRLGSDVQAVLSLSSEAFAGRHDLPSDWFPNH